MKGGMAKKVSFLFSFFFFIAHFAQSIRPTRKDRLFFSLRNSFYSKKKDSKKTTTIAAPIGLLFLFHEAETFAKFPKRLARPLIRTRLRHLESLDNTCAP